MSPKSNNNGDSKSTRSSLVYRQPKAVPKRHEVPNRTQEPPRYKPPSKWQKEIRYYQKGTQLLIPAAAFSRLVREVVLSVTKSPEIRFQEKAMKTLHEAAEAYIVGLLEDSYLCTMHAKRVTLMAKDLRLAYRIRGDVTSMGL